MAKIINRNQDFSKWYTSVVLESKIADYGLVKGTIIFKPYGWKIWNNIRSILTKLMEDLGTQECYLPLMIPYSEFQKEKKHVEGFNPELFMVSKIGDKNIEDPLVVRPTSEISFCNYFKKEISSYNDLPLILNQWCNVFRVEKNTRPFLRTSEFFWQEQHAIFESEKEAVEFSLKMINLYKKFVNDYLCLDVIVGEKTENERFAGAEKTYTIEAIMPDGQALQSATSHYLGTNFSRNFDIKFQNKNNKFDFVFQTSAGMSTRIMGALIMSHSDDNGLVLPFKIAPIQFAIVYNQESTFVNDVKKILKKYNTKDFISEKSMGLTLQNNELMGIPFQIILGKKEIEKNEITIYRRDTKQKISIKFDEFNSIFIEDLISEYSKNLFSNSQKRTLSKIKEVDNIEDFKKELDNKNFILAYWSGGIEDEKKLKDLTGATARCILIDSKTSPNHKCFFTKKENPKLVYFARSY